jgi:transposase InsO family protein
MLNFILLNKNNNMEEEVSQLQYQLRELLPRLSAQAKSLRDGEAKERYYLIKAVAQSLKDVKKTCESRGRSTSYFYKWAERLVETESLESLKTISKAPKHSPNKVDSRIEKRICRVRRKYPYMGPEAILHELRTKGLKVLPHPSTIYQVLLRNDFIKEEYKKALTKKHMKRYRQPYPGYLQMDFKHVPYAIGGEKYYQLSCVDHHSSWRLIRSYRHKDLGAVVDFLAELKELCPFFIVQIQTDNDKSFTDKYRPNTDGLPTGGHVLDQWCKRYGIEHRLIPIGQKELNGKVENTHKWDDREHFSQTRPESLLELQELTIKYNTRWNKRRATKALGWRTPNHVIYAAQFLKRFLNLWFAPEREKHLPTNIINLVNIKQAKRKDPVHRYLQYMDWDHDQSFTLSAISPNFSLTN